MKTRFDRQMTKIDPIPFEITTVGKKTISDYTDLELKELHTRLKVFPIWSCLSSVISHFF